MERNPVGEHQADGIVDSVIKQFQGAVQDNGGRIGDDILGKDRRRSLLSAVLGDECGSDDHVGEVG